MVSSAARWPDEVILERLREDAECQGAAPKALDWALATPDRPAARTVALRFGSWSRALAAAGLRARPLGGGSRCQPWSRRAVLKALRREYRETGRWPTCSAWKHSARGRPCAATVARVAGSGSFRLALERARAGVNP